MAALAAFLQSRTGAAIALLLFMLAIVLPGQWTIPPIDRDEPRFAQATRQMVETGDYVDIRYLDAPRHLQPAGIYWLQAASLKLTGEADQPPAIWPHRVPSWFSAIGLAFMAWWVGALLFGPMTGRLAAVLMGSALLLAAEARIAKIDATLAFATLLSMAAFAKHYLAAQRGEPRPHWGFAALFWAALGWGVLLKGPIIILVVGGAALALFAVERKAGWMASLRPLWGAPLMLAIALPWYIAIGIVTDWEFFRTALGYSVVGKVAESHQSHGGPFGFHTMLFTGLFWPGSLFALLALPFAWANRAKPEVKLLAAWVIPAWIVFEISGTKLPHYTLPLYPAFAILAAAFLANASGVKLLGAKLWWFVVAAFLWTVFAIVPLAAVPALVSSQEGGLPVAVYAITGLCALFTLAVLALAAQGRGYAAALLSAGLAALAYVNSFGVALPRLETLFMSPRLVEAAARHAPCPGSPESVVVTTPYHEPSFAFLSGGKVVLAGSAEEAGAALAADPQCRLALIGAEREETFLAESARLGLAVRPLETIEGRNHNEGGDTQKLTLYAVAPN